MEPLRQLKSGRSKRASYNGEQQGERTVTRTRSLRDSARSAVASGRRPEAPPERSSSFDAKRPGGDDKGYVMQERGGGDEAVAHHPTGVSGLTWSGDGKAIYFLAADAKTAAAKERDGVKDDVFAFDENYQQVHLWKIALDTTSET